MSRWRDLAVATAIVVSQSCWLFLVGAILGAFAMGRAPLLPWLVLLLQLAATTALARGLSVSPLPDRWSRGFGLMFSLLFLYLALGFHYGLWWPVRFSAGDGAMDATRMGLALVLALGVLWRGVTLGTVSNPEATLRGGFKLGLTVLVATALVELGYKVNFGVRLVAFPFFASSLAGLALLTLEADEGQQRTRWGRLLIATIGGSLALGVLFSLGVGSTLSGVATGFFRVLGFVGYYASLAAFFVLEKAIRALFWALRAIGNAFGDPGAVRFLRPPSFLEQRPEASEVEKVGGVWGFIASSVQWGLLALLILGVLLFIYWLFRKRSRLDSAGENEVRESVRGEEDEGALLGALLPHVRPREHLDLYPLPQGEGPRERLFRVYFQALNAALHHGLGRKPSETPSEYAPRLAALHPGAPVRDLSAEFARARYSDWTPPEDEVARLEEGLRPNGHRPPA
ncbi:MAG: DUF4129 domain-containing protein [SAR202 cluster bacterium]|nr:DUF4129 domain-containing protein [SAR202 cluster bacterium]